MKQVDPVKRSKISDVAKTAEVSLSTVSNYLNGRYDNMSYETRKRVEEAVRSLKYTPNISARRLSAKKKCGVLCLVIPVNISHFFDSFYYPIVLSSVGNLSVQLDQNVLIFVRNGRNPQEETEYLKGMHGAIADGFILFDLVDGDEYYMEFARSGIPYVCVGEPTTTEDCIYVASDHRRSIEEAVEYLAALGHRKISLVLDKGNGVVKVVRYQAYRDALKRHGLPFREEYLLYSDLDVRSGSKECRKFIEGLLTSQDPPTALITFAGYAQDVEYICKKHGYSIPRDLSVVLLDYVDAIYTGRLRYTCFRNIADQASEHAVHLLMQQIQHPEQPVKSELIPLALSVGESTAAPK